MAKRQREMKKMEKRRAKEEKMALRRALKREQSEEAPTAHEEVRLSTDL